MSPLNLLSNKLPVNLCPSSPKSTLSFTIVTFCNESLELAFQQVAGEFVSLLSKFNSFLYNCDLLQWVPWTCFPTSCRWIFVPPLQNQLFPLQLAALSRSAVPPLARWALYQNLSIISNIQSSIFIRNPKLNPKPLPILVKNWIHSIDYVYYSQRLGQSLSFFSFWWQLLQSVTNLEVVLQDWTKKFLWKSRIGPHGDGSWSMV